MSNYNSLKTTINANVKQNGRQEITGQILNSVLNQMVNTLGAGYQFAGVATTATNPGSPDAKVFYIANGKGIYANFGGLQVTEDDVVVLYWDSSWHKVSTGIASQAKLSELDSKIGGFTPTIIERITHYHDEYTWAGGQVRADNGVVVSSISPKASGFIDVEGYDSVEFTGAIHYTDSVYGYAFYDADEVYISGERYTIDKSLSARGYEVYNVAVPSNAKYFRCTLYNPPITSPSVWYLTLTKLMQEGKSAYETIGDIDSLLTEDKTSVVASINELVGKIDASVIKSKYLRDSNYGFPTSEWYECLQSPTNTYGRNTKSADIFAAFDAMANASDGYMSMSVLGNSVNNQPIKMYRLNKPKYNLSGVKKSPKVIIISGQQGFEKSDVYGLYYFFKDLCESAYDNDTLQYLREQVEFICIPIVNPDGWDTLSYCNANSISLNRNYATNNWRYVHSDTDISQNSGDYPFSEPETQIVRELILANTDADFIIDYHTNGQWSVTDYKNVNWVSFNALDTNLSDRKVQEHIVNACIAHVTRMTDHFNREFELGLPIDTLCGYVGLSNTSPGTLKTWVKEQGFLGTTFEGFNGFPNRSSYNGEAQKACAELMGNFINIILYYLSKINI